VRGLFGHVSAVFRSTKNGAPDPVAFSIADAIQSAIGHHQSGRLQEAEALYDAVLVVDPNHFDALHLTGVVSHQMGNNDRAVALIGKAIEVQPTSHVALGHLALAYQALGRLDEAEQSLRSAIALKPEWDKGHNMLGVVFCARRQFDKADESFRTALALNAANFDALNNLAGVCMDQGALDEAEGLYGHVLTLRADFPEVHNNLGSLFRRRGDLARAEKCCLQALVLRPNYAEAHNNLGVVLQAQGKFEAAEDSFQAALGCRSDFPDALCNLGDVLQVMGRLEEAEAFCRSALAIRPSYPQALSNLGAILKARSDLDGAEALCRQALSLDVRHVGAWINLGTILNERFQRDEAERCYRRALELDPTNAGAKFNLSALLLLRGEYLEGFALYESRFEAFSQSFTGSRGLYGRLTRPATRQGDAIVGRHILVWTEQGLGDALMMMRYLPLLKRERGAARITVFCEDALVRVMESISGVDEVVSGDISNLPPDFDVHCSVMSLPYIFRTGEEAVLCQTPYLVVPDALKDVWANRLRGMQKFKVGLAWAGNRMLRDDAKRSIALSEFSPLLDVRDIQIVSLQKGDAANSVASWDGRIVDWMPECEDFMETAALISNLDLVVSVDTAVVHLSGALGKPTWLLNRFESEWRWGIGRGESAWYPSVRILTQHASGSWQSLMTLIAAKLAEFRPSRPGA